MPKSLEDFTPNELVAALSQAQPKVTLYDQLMADPETRADMLRLTKKKHPGLSIPELDTKAELERELAKEREEREKLASEIREREVNRRIKEDKEAALAKHKLPETALPEIEKLMVDSKIPDYDTAAELYSHRQRSAEPTPSLLSSPMYDMPDKGTWGKGIGNPALLNKIGVDMAFKAANEFRTGKVVQQ